MKISVIGCGYVGLVTGACLAHIGHDVLCVDENLGKIKKLRRGVVPIFEPGLQELVDDGIKRRRLTFSSSIEEATRCSPVIFIAVGTPSMSNGQADLASLEKVVRHIAKHIDSYKLIVEKSTVPAATGEKIRRVLRSHVPKKSKESREPAYEFDVAANPEFLREGAAIHDFMHPDRVVIGVETKRAEDLLREVYRPLKPRFIFTNIASAEMIKHASNSFLATKISFINAVSKICDQVGADVVKVAEGMGWDKRIKSQFLNAGVGYGGSCFPKDVDAFIFLGENIGYDFHLLKAVRSINEEQKKEFVQLVEDKLWNLREKTLAVWGVAFKSNTDDVRSSVALDIIGRLMEEGARIKIYDPQATDKAREILKGAVFSSDPLDAVQEADGLLLLTEWDEFRDVDFNRVYAAMRRPIIFDGRNFLNRKRLQKAGFEYFGIGRGIKKPVKKFRR
jgi:UDPglucose 6-dehydrogenase